MSMLTCWSGRDVESDHDGGADDWGCGQASVVKSRRSSIWAGTMSSVGI